MCQSDLECKVCFKVIQTRLPFKITRERADGQLQILHTDLCGPIEPETFDGKK